MDTYHRTCLRQHERRVFRAIKPDHQNVVEAWCEGEGDTLGRRSLRAPPESDDTAPRVIRFFNNRRELKPDERGKVTDPREPLKIRPRTTPAGRRPQFQPKFVDERPPRAPTYALGRKVADVIPVDDAWLDGLAEKLRVLREANKKRAALTAGPPKVIDLADKEAVRQLPRM